ncbi:MAG: TonB family protein [Proteobacteria bacterium]|nr:TonB family protein [Pseudomonadota bacterium]
MRAVCMAATVAVHGLVLLPVALLETRAPPPEPEATVQLALIAETESEEAEETEPEVASDEHFDAVDASVESMEASEPADALPVQEAPATEQTKAAPDVSEAIESPADRTEPPVNAEQQEAMATESLVTPDTSPDDIKETPAEEAPAAVVEKPAAPEVQASQPEKSPEKPQAVPEQPKPKAKDKPQPPKDTKAPPPKDKPPNKPKAAPGKEKVAKKGGNAVAGKDQRGGDKSGGAANAARYRAIVQSRLSGRRGALASRGGKGTVSIRFTIGPSGAVVSASVARSSGNGALDAAARSLVASTSFPPPPGGRFSGVVPFKVN